MADVPEDLTYSAEHEWVRGEVAAGSTVTVGISRHAADALGDVVYVEAPRVGDTVTAGQVCGELESSKAVSELYSPVTGVVMSVNEALTADPSPINADPYGEGWIFTVEVTDAGGELLDAAAYSALIA
ncbi:MAG: glycine cleavage system protein GcvH [Actinomycetes bacterium]|nr:MAG: glycine cleavage system protein GcvH [Actinomycetota bacterium]